MERMRNVLALVRKGVIPNLPHSYQQEQQQQQQQQLLQLQQKYDAEKAIKAEREMGQRIMQRCRLRQIGPIEWMTVGINDIPWKNCLVNTQITVHPREDYLHPVHLTMAEEEEGPRSFVQFVQGEVSLSTALFTERPTLVKFFNLFLHQLLAQQLDKYKDACHVPIQLTNTTDRQQEEAHLRWLQGSMLTLQGALQETQRDPAAKLLQAAFFCGKRPEQRPLGEEVMRVVCFNLDMLIFFPAAENAHKLLITIYDDPENFSTRPALAVATPATPIFSYAFNARKYEAYNEIIKLVHLIGLSAELPLLRE